MNRETFISRAKLKTRDIDIPDLGIVKVRELSAAQVSAYASEAKAGKEEIDLLASLVIGSVVDESGKPIFSDTDQDRKVVRDMPLSILKAVAETAADLAGITADSKKN